MEERPEIKLEDKEMIKLLTFAIMVKRRRRNSVLLEHPTKKEAAAYGMCLSTFKKYRQMLLDIGWMDKSIYGNYHIIRFNGIVSSFYKTTGFHFGMYGIFEKGTIATDFKTALRQVELILLDDNVRKVQVLSNQHHSESGPKLRPKRGKPFTAADVRGHHSLKMYFEMGFPLDKLLRAQKSKGKSAIRKVSVDTQKLPFCKTSARHAGQKLNMSKDKASKLLNTPNPHFDVKEHSYHVVGCNDALYDMLCVVFPDATIIPQPYLGFTKVCFGREIVEKGQKFIDFRFKGDPNPLTTLYMMHKRGQIKVLNFKLWKKRKPSKKKYRELNFINSINYKSYNSTKRQSESI